ncbi:Romo1/Mgr2 [Dillenia turbinata]|uniref:Romo1/Mgr2 n=1 Tax=Dillenia turbinata TaxID=194707 RepID=A0AAN8V2W8_9MAGN
MAWTRDSCLARVTTGVAVGGAVGGAVGAVYGTYEAIRNKLCCILSEAALLFLEVATWSYLCAFDFQFCFDAILAK